MYNKEIKILSWGGGSQSSAILQLYLHKKVELDYIIFADTGLEPTYIYRQINDWLKEPKIKAIFHKVSANTNLKQMIENYINGNKKSLRMFIYTYNPITNHYGSHPKTCTGTYKIIPNQSKVNQLIREKYNLTKRAPVKHIKQIIYIGFSADEQRRIKKMKDTNNIQYRFPLNELNMSFVDTINYLKKNNRGVYRSACFICPFRNDNVNGMGWIDILKNDYDNFAIALEYDVKIRNCKNSERFEYNLYFDSSCIPLWYIYKNQIKDTKLIEKLQKLDKNGISDLNIKNRKYKKNKLYNCNESVIGSCSL